MNFIYTKKPSMFRNLASKLEGAKFIKNGKDLIKNLTTPKSLILLFVHEEELMSHEILEIKESFPSIKIFTLSNTPTLSKAQKALSLGVSGYGNIFICPSYLNEAIMTISKGENWIFPLQEELSVENKEVATITFLQGSLEDESKNRLKNGQRLKSNQKLSLFNGVASIVLDSGSTIDLQGKEALFLDESVHEDGLNKELKIFSNPLFSPHKPFYINVGKESLIDATSKEIELKDNKNSSLYSFTVEEGKGLKKDATLSIDRSIEDCELIYSKELASLLINDKISKKSFVVYEPIQKVLFTNAAVDLLLFPENKKVDFNFGKNISFFKLTMQSIEELLFEAKGTRQGKDFLLFDRRELPSNIKLNYGIDNDGLFVSFNGTMSANSCKELLKTLRYESSSGDFSNSINLSITLIFNNERLTLYEGSLDTLCNIGKK